MMFSLPFTCCLHFDLINIHVFDYPDSRLSGLFTKVPTSPDNRGSTVTIFKADRPWMSGCKVQKSAKCKVQSAKCKLLAKLQCTGAISEMPARLYKENPSDASTFLTFSMDN